MSTPATFEQRATAAGATLRAAFYEGDPMTAPTTFRPPSLEQPTGGRSRGRALLAAAAAVAALAAGTAVVLGGGDDERTLPPATETEEKVVTGMLQVPGYPLRLTVPSELYEVDEDAGSRAFRLVSQQRGGVLLTALRSVNGTPAAALPSDVTTLLASRPDVVVSDKGTTTVSGRPAQFFTLGVAPGAQPADLWCPVGEPLCFKLDPALTSEILLVETSAEPLWIATEYSEASRSEVRRLAEQLISSIELLPASSADVQGASIVLPSTWKVSARADRYLQAGDPTKRDTEGVNIIVPSSVQQPDGTLIDTPDDAAAWLESRAGLDVSALGDVEVDGRTGRLLLAVPTASSQTLWCGTTDPTSCFNTGAEGALYAVVPYGGETLVVEVLAMTGTDPQVWAQSTRNLLTRVELR